MADNLVSGRVIAKETGQGIPDLLVVLYDLEPATSPDGQGTSAGLTEGVVSAAAADGSGNFESSLGTRITDASGAFSFAYVDGEYQIRNTKKKRPALALSVLAPDEPGRESTDQVLFTTRKVRIGAGRTEEYLIRLPADVLANAGIAVPLEPGLVHEDPRQMIERLAKAETWRTDLKAEARKLAEARIGKVREETKRIDDSVRQGIVAALTNRKPPAENSANIVLGAEPVEPAVWASANRRIKKVNEAAPVKGYLILTPEQAQAYRDGAGWRTDLTEAEIAPYLYREGDGGRPASYVLDDPAEAMRRALASEASARALDSASPPANATTQPDDGDISPVAVEMSSADLPILLSRVMQDLAGGAVVASQDGADPVPRGRPTAADVQASVAGLSLASGPADVTAFHDYSTLQIAFDHVWRELLDPAVVETGQALARQLYDAGADPLAAMAEAGVHPIEALRREVGYVARINNPFDDSLLPDWVRGGDLPILPGYQPPHGGGGGGGGGGSPPPEPGTGPTVPTTTGPNAGVVGPRPSTADPGPRSIHELLDELEGLLDDTYKFDVFAAGSVNFGLMVTYRQKWRPITYQAGDLVQTLTLTPKETRKISTRRTVKRERAVKENESNLRNRSDESKSTLRADAEVVDRAATKSNFSLSAKGSYSFGVASAEGSTSMDRGADASSQETKKSFHESVISAAMQMRAEKSWTFETKDMFEDESTSTSEITNPNDELTVSYLFYELERRYRVSEHLHKLTPVVLVAMEVPEPGRQPIDKILLAHSWIINRVLLDDRYRAPLEYLCNRIVGDELGLTQMARGVAAINAVVTQLQATFKRSQADLLVREANLNAAITRRADRIAGDNSEGALVSAMEWLGGSGSEDDVEAARVIEDMRRESYERAAKEQKELSMRLDAETASLNAANEAYAKAYAEHMNRRMEVGGLRAHFKENVLYYMQAIWSFTFEDQIYFQVYDVKAPVITTQAASYSLREVTDPPLSIPIVPGRIVLEVSADVTLATADVTVEEGATSLAQIADLDRPLGFKGNYMIFPLKESNPLTDLMMTPYLNTEFGLHDPDELGAWAPEDFLDYATALLQAKTAEGSMTADELSALRSELQARYKRILTSPRLLNDEIVVPTDSLFIEALPGAHPLLEDFKLQHRRLDVEKVREETRRMQLEGLRYAARILSDKLDDPDIERQIVVQGAGGLVLPADQ